MKNIESTVEFQIEKWNVGIDELSLDASNRKSPWFTAPGTIVKIYRKMQEQPRLGDTRKLSQGINTRGGDDIYFFKEAAKGEPGYVVGVNHKGDKVRVESELVYPLIQGKDFDEWHFKAKHAVIPHRPPTWSCIGPIEMKRTFPDALSYFEKHKRQLSERSLLSKKSTSSYYVVPEISVDKVGRWKVAWADIAVKLKACVIPPKIDDPLVGTKNTLTDSTVQFVNVENEAEAQYLCGVLNSKIATSFSYNFARPKGGAPFRGFRMWSVAILPVPSFKNSKRDNDVVKFAKKLASDGTDEKVREKLEATIAMLYGLNEDEVNSLHGHYLLMSGKNSKP
ncbi:MAG TPA: hypothetical protein VN739_08910 [Nitrososphaerales archaeon]|nr:hypothetical protein [Nitrososphaerales archaeon]